MRSNSLLVGTRKWAGGPALAFRPPGLVEAISGGLGVALQLTNNLTFPILCVVAFEVIRSVSETWGSQNPDRDPIGHPTDIVPYTWNLFSNFSVLNFINEKYSAHLHFSSFAVHSADPTQPTRVCSCGLRAARAALFSLFEYLSIDCGWSSCMHG